MDPSLFFYFPHESESPTRRNGPKSENPTYFRAPVDDDPYRVVRVGPGAGAESCCDAPTLALRIPVLVTPHQPPKYDKKSLFAQ
jgi:hypothetical protein